MTDWIELKTLQDVAKAEADGLEIEYRHMAKESWNPWSKTWWQEDSFYRGRPRPPKMKTVKMMCWISPNWELHWRVSDPLSNYWIRVPEEDRTVEIPEGV